jgi:hypothetical protein
MNRTNRRRAPDPQPDAGWLAAALREQAHRHEADPGRISARFEHLIAGEHRPAEPRRAEPRRYAGPARLRLIGVPLGFLVLASAIVAVAVSLGLGNSPAVHPSSKVAALPDGPGSTAATSGPGSLSASSVALPAATPPPAATPARSATTPTRPAGPLTAAGTVDPHSSQYWAQENLTVTTTRPIRELDVTVAVSGGPAVRSTGAWTTLLPADVETTVRSVPDGLVYDITLKAGQTLQPTAYKFGFQFNRPSAGHKFTLDTYRVSAVTIDGATESASGTF